jgi:hypothetical protein
MWRVRVRVRARVRVRVRVRVTVSPPVSEENAFYELGRRVGLSTSIEKGSDPEPGVEAYCLLCKVLFTDPERLVKQRLGGHCRKRALRVRVSCKQARLPRYV